MKKFDEKNVAENPLYHDTWKLLKKYRDVVWSLELSVQHVRTKFEIEYGTSIEDFLDSVYLAGADLAGSDIEHHAKCIERSHKMLKLLDSAVDLLRTKHKNGEAYPDNYEILSTDAALRAERIACRLRHLIYSSTSIQKGEYLQSASVAQGISIAYENGVLEVTLPGLLPKRRQRQSSEFLLDTLYFALEQYAKEQPLPHYRNCVVCFAQVYDQTLPTRRVRDYDNLEEKQLLDLLSTFVMADDTGLLCDAYNTTELGEQDCTKIFVMEKSGFPNGLQSAKRA